MTLTLPLLEVTGCRKRRKRKQRQIRDRRFVVGVDGEDPRRCRDRWNPRNNPYNEAPPEEAKNKGTFRNYVDIKGERGARGSVSRGIRDVVAPPLLGSSIVNENYRPGF